MVTFNPSGRFGNWFMECCTVISYALKHGLDFSVPNKTNSQYWNPVYCLHLHNGDLDPNKETIRIPETTHAYTPIPFEESWRNKNIIIEGYRQTEKYWKEHRSEILYLLGFKWERIPDVCSIHARFGDYLQLPQKHILLNTDYLLRAMSYMKEKTGIARYKVFSDDINYFKKEFGHLYDFEYSTNTNELDDVVEISCCHSHINSSSTFSWAGAWMNRNLEKVIVTPEHWFQPGWGGLDVSDIIPNEWVKM